MRSTQVEPLTHFAKHATDSVELFLRRRKKCSPSLPANVPQALDISVFLTISGRSHFLQKPLFYPSAISRKLASWPKSRFWNTLNLRKKNSVLLNSIPRCNSVHTLDDFFAHCRLLRLWKVMGVCLWIAWPSAFLCIVVRQILQQSRLLIALMVRNPIKHTISGTMTGLWQV